MYLVHADGDPAWARRRPSGARVIGRYPLPGDSVITMIHRVIIDVDPAQVVRLQMPPDQHRGTLGDNISMDDCKWSPDGSTARVRVGLARSQARLAARGRRRHRRGAHASSTRRSPTQFESRDAAGRCSGPATRSSGTRERDNWGQLYLYDLTTGQLKNQITTGDGPCIADARASTRRRGRSGSRRRDASRARIRTSATTTGSSSTAPRLVSLTPDDGDHAVAGLARRASTWSTPTRSPTCRRSARCATPRPAAGDAAREGADISQLRAAGWKPPTPITMKARDGKTDIYGLMFTPTNFDPATEVPDRQQRLPGTADRQHGQPRVHRRARRRAGARRARLRRRHDRRHGHARSRRRRSRTRTTARWARQHDPRPDRRHEGARRSSIPCIDIDRAGIWGHSGGGFATTDGDVPLSRLLQGRHRRVRQPRQARVRRRLGRALPGPARRGTPTAPTATTPRRTRTSRRTSRATCCWRTARWTTTCRRTTRCSSSTR